MIITGRLIIFTKVDRLWESKTRLQTSNSELHVHCCFYFNTVVQVGEDEDSIEISKLGKYSRIHMTIREKGTITLGTKDVINCEEFEAKAYISFIIIPLVTYIMLCIYYVFNRCLSNEYLRTLKQIRYVISQKSQMRQQQHLRKNSKL